MTDYTKTYAQANAKAHFTGIWAATLTPFTAEGGFDETGFAANIDHWVGALGVDGLFVSGNQGEYFSMSVAERMRSFEIAADVVRSQARTVASCADPSPSPTGSYAWLELLGQIGGPVRRPLLALTPIERARISEHFSRSGLLRV